MEKKAILLVDDETKVLSSLSRSLLMEDYNEIKTATNGQEGLDLINETADLAVVVSDYMMPGMNGIDFLARAREIRPDASRILLTGLADLEMALDAVNKGNVYRFLLKPCPSDVFIGAIQDGIRYHQLITGEKELLSKTLNGSIKVMIDILAAVNPDIFAKASRLRKLGHELAFALRMEDQSWEVELSALLSQVGAVTIPRNVMVKWQTGGILDESEREMVKTIPKVSKQLISNVPRLENIAKAVGYQDCTYSRPNNLDYPTGKNIPVIARILKIIIDYDQFLERNYVPIKSYQSMLKHEEDYDPDILGVFAEKVIRLEKQPTGKVSDIHKGEKEIYVDDLKLGMVLSRDVVDKNGILIVARNTTITEVMMYKLINYFHSQAIIEPVSVQIDG